jgi:hypothetical protein
MLYDSILNTSGIGSIQRARCPYFRPTNSGVGSAIEMLSPSRWRQWRGCRGSHCIRNSSAVRILAFRQARISLMTRRTVVRIELDRSASRLTT